MVIFFPTFPESKYLCSLYCKSPKFTSLKENGYKIGNIDSIIVAQAPKMRPHIDKMRENIANACGVDVSKISVKATTEEWLGFTGNGEGISAKAVALIEEI